MFSNNNILIDSIHYNYEQLCSSFFGTRKTEKHLFIILPSVKIRISTTYFFPPTDLCFIIQPVCTKEVQTDPHIPYLVDFPLERASGNKHVNSFECTSVIYKFIFSVKTNLVPKPGKNWNYKTDSSHFFSVHATSLEEILANDTIKALHKLHSILLFKNFTKMTLVFALPM